MFGEVAPLLVPQFDALLVSLLAIAGCIVAIGLVSIIHRVATGTVGTVGLLLGAVPGVGHVLASPVNAVVQWMDHAFGSAEFELDQLLGRFLHSAAELLKWVGHEIRANAHLGYVLAMAMVGPHALAWIVRLVRHARGYAETARHDALAAVRFMHAVELRGRHLLGAAESHAVGAVRSEVSALGHWTHGRVTALQHSVGYTLPQELHGLGGRVGHVELEAAALQASVRLLERRVAGEGAVALVDTGLARLGGDWIKCRNWRKIGRHGCGGLGGLLEPLLENAVEALLIADLCQVAGLIGSAAAEFEPVLDELVNAQALVCRIGGAKYATGIIAADLRHGGGHATAIIATDLKA